MTKNHDLDGNEKSCDDCPTKKLGFFCSMNNEIYKTIDHIKIDFKIQAGDSLYLAGSSPTGLYSVIDGIIKVEIPTDDGKVNILNFIGPGGLLGYRSLFKNAPHTTTALAVIDSSVSFLPGAQVKQLFECHRELTLKLISQLVDDTNQIETRWQSQIHHSAPSRIAEALLFLNEHFNDVYWTRKEVAEWAGTTPETVIRTLSNFENEGLIGRNQNKFTILDSQGLEDKISMS